MEETVQPELADEPETTGSDAANLHWLDQYCSDQYIADQYTDVANAFKGSELDKELSERLSDLEEGRLQSTSSGAAKVRAPAPATAPMLRSGTTPKSPRVPNIPVPPLVASEESNTDSDSDATVSDLTIHSESESDETPTQSTYSSPLVGVHIPRTLSSFVGQKLPTSTCREGRHTVLKVPGRQAPGKATKPERREVHFAEEHAVRYFKK
jgi:hypothetical protein